MEAGTYQQRAMARQVTRDRESALVLGSLGMVREASEAAEHVERELFFDVPVDPKKVLEELGDTLWYLTLLAHTLGFTIEDVMEFNDAKLQKRYGDNFSTAKWKADREARGADVASSGQAELEEMAIQLTLFP